MLELALAASRMDVLGSARTAAETHHEGPADVIETLAGRAIYQDSMYSTPIDDWRRYGVIFTECMQFALPNIVRLGKSS